MKGFIVTRAGEPCEYVTGFDSGCPRASALLWGGTVSIFSTRRRARAAIRRTWQFADSRGLDWDQGDPHGWRIWPVRGVD